MSTTTTKVTHAGRRPSPFPSFGRIASVPRVGFAVAVAACGALLGLCVAIPSLPDAVRPLTSVAALGMLGATLARRALATGVPAGIGAIAVLPMSVGILSAAIAGHAAFPVLPGWEILAAASASFLIVPARRARQDVADRGFRLGLGLSACIACAAGLAASPPFGLDVPWLGTASMASSIAMAVSAVGIAVARGVGEPRGDRVHVRLADTDQVWGSLVVFALGIAAAAYALATNGMAADLSRMPALVVPTGALYAAPVLGIYWIAFGRLRSTKAFWAACLVASACALLSWYEARREVAEAVSRHSAAVSVDLRRPASPEIDAIVYDMGRPVDPVAAMSGLQGLRIFEKDGGRLAEIASDGRRVEAATLPDRHFRVFPVPFGAGVPDSRATMVEQVEFGRAMVIALDVEARIEEPLIPPMVGPGGWVSATRTLHPVDPAAPRRGSPDLKASGFVSAVLKGRTFFRNPAD